MQGAQVTQNGNTNSIGSLGFKEIEQKNVPKANTMTSAKDMSTAEISKMLKEFMPHQKKINECVQELLRRSVALKTTRTATKSSK